ncbi:MAG: hypothetical protein V1844_09855 [Pseudomonadota bacterium]
MNAKELFISEGAPAGIWFCSECRNVAKTQSQAEDCCKKHDCRFCGKPVDEKHRLVHRICAEQDTIAKAEKLEAWDGYIYLEGVGKEYFESIGELLDEHDIDGIPAPEYVFICSSIPFTAPDIDKINDWVCDEHDSDAVDCLWGVEELSEALKNFESINQHIIRYEPDFTKMVRIRNVDEKE